MDRKTEPEIRAAIAQIETIPYGNRSEGDKVRLNALEAELLLRRPPGRSMFCKSCCLSF